MTDFFPTFIRTLDHYYLTKHPRPVSQPRVCKFCLRNPRVEWILISRYKMFSGKYFLILVLLHYCWYKYCFWNKFKSIPNFHYSIYESSYMFWLQKVAMIRLCTFQSLDKHHVLYCGLSMLQSNVNYLYWYMCNWRVTEST